MSNRTDCEPTFYSIDEVIGILEIAKSQGHTHIGINLATPGFWSPYLPDLQFTILGEDQRGISSACYAFSIACPWREVTENAVEVDLHALRKAMEPIRTQQQRWFLETDAKGGFPEGWRSDR